MIGGLDEIIEEIGIRVKEYEKQFGWKYIGHKPKDILETVIRDGKVENWHYICRNHTVDPTNAAVICGDTSTCTKYLPIIAIKIDYTTKFGEKKTAIVKLMRTSTSDKIWLMVTYDGKRLEKIYI